MVILFISSADSLRAATLSLIPLIDSLLSDMARLPSPRIPAIPPIGASLAKELTIVRIFDTKSVVEAALFDASMLS